MMINPKINIDATLCFEISNSEMYGGVGSVGYYSVKFGGITDIASLDDTFIVNQIKRTAEFLSVSQDDVRLISKEEYDQATEEQDVENDEDNYCDEDAYYDEEDE